MSRREELAERILCAMIAASYGEEGYVPPLKDEDFVQDPNGDWCKESGSWRPVGYLSVLPSETKRYSMVTTYQRRMARDAMLQADVMLAVETESVRLPVSAQAETAESIVATPLAGLRAGRNEVGAILNAAGNVVYRIKTVPSLDDLQVPLAVRAQLEAQLKADAALFAAAHGLASALREIAEPLDCGCKPCTGACASADMRELHDAHREIANKALASIPGGAA